MSIDARAAEQGLIGKPLNRLLVPTLTSGDGCEIIDNVREVPIATLAPGRRFELVLTATTKPPYKRIRGLLVRKGPGTVAVAIERGGRQFGTAEGGQVTIPGTTEIVYWSPGTPVIPLTTKDGKPLTGDIGRWTTKGGTGVGLDMHHPDNYTLATKTDTAPDGENGEVDMGDRVAVLPGVKAGAGSKIVKGKMKVVKAAKSPKELHPCLCGCGDRVAGRFRQGHDGRYYSIIKKVIAGEMEFTKIPKQMQNDLGNAAGAKKALKDSGH